MTADNVSCTNRKPSERRIWSGSQPHGEFEVAHSRLLGEYADFAELVVTVFEKRRDINLRQPFNRTYKILRNIVRCLCRVGVGTAYRFGNYLIAYTEIV